MRAFVVESLHADELLAEYARQGAYTDCYRVDLPLAVTLADYVHAFYTTPLFKMERTILALAVAKPSTDLQSKQLATGEINSFAAWSVEARTQDQLLVRDFRGRTRSWFKCAAADGGNATRLYFGSAVVPKRSSSRHKSFGFVFHALLGFHRLYSRMLLSSARSRLLRANAQKQNGI